ncbi:unnamed protein product [Paramecium primaurelia]|uniref:Transmembrane protein n=1 Tax=Paramecium primaurelia TaxID=5886 RepID=A0A8S1Q9Q1_PARPR|nr:unnamed protein product [Paramecium primaurelia]
MNKMLIFIPLLIFQNVYAQQTNYEKCALIIKSIFAGLSLTYQTNQINYMENLDCNGFLDDIAKSVEYSNGHSLEQLKIGWDELGNALGKIQESIIKNMNQNALDNNSQLLWIISFVNNLKLKLKNKIVCELDEQTEKIIELIFDLNIFSDQFKNFNEEQYQTYGYSIGQMLSKIQLKIVNFSSISQEMEIALKVFSGFQYGIQDQSLINKDQLKKCLEGADQIVIYYDDFSQQIDNFMYILYPLCVHKQIYLALNHYINALDKCSDSITNASKLSQRLKQLIKVLENKKLLNRIDKSYLLEYAQYAVISWHMGYWFGFGEEIGIYLAKLEIQQQSDQIYQRKF